MSEPMTDERLVMLKSMSLDRYAHELLREVERLREENERLLQDWTNDIKSLNDQQLGLLEAKYERARELLGECEERFRAEHYNEFAAEIRTFLDGEEK